MLGEISEIGQDDVDEQADPSDTLPDSSAPDRHRDLQLGDRSDRDDLDNQFDPRDDA